MSEDSERMLTTEEVAALFRVSGATVRRWALRYPQQFAPVKITPGRQGQWRWPERKAQAALVAGLHEEVPGA